MVKTAKCHRNVHRTVSLGPARSNTPAGLALLARLLIAAGPGSHDGYCQDGYCQDGYCQDGYCQDGYLRTGI